MTPVWDLPAVRAGIARQAEALQRELDAGASLLGWKVGVGAPESLRTAQIPAPLVGFLTSRTVLPDGAGVPLSGWVRPVLEPELAIHLNADVEPDAAPHEARAAIAAIGIAMELADVDAGLDDLQRVVGGDIFHRAVLLGDPDSGRRGGVVEDLEAVVVRGDQAIARADDVTALTASPADTVLHVARWLAAAGLSLQAGQMIIAGSIVPIVDVSPGDRVMFRCGTLGALKVSFTD